MKYIPVATYRLQFNRSFTLHQATEILDYLNELGVSDLYSSPVFEAGAESTHGYDVCCFGKINPIIGSEEDFERFCSRRQELGLGLLLDTVPNHMAAALSNGWWRDVLKNGRNSKYAAFFDIDWEPVNPSLRNKVLLPILEDHYANVLESGKLRLEFEAGEFFIGYHDHQLPIAPTSIPVPAKQNPQRLIQELTGHPDEPRSFEKLHALLQWQHYRLACWRTASEAINYRRFFDISELVALRMELPEVFTAVHELILEWLKQGKVTGLRIDHPDGLRNPKLHFERIQALFYESRSGVRPDELHHSDHSATGSNSGHSAQSVITPTATIRDSAVESFYVVAEKILSGNELLPDDWPIDGTTGYDFLNRVNGLFIDRQNESHFDRIYREFIGGESNFEPVVFQSKILILETSMAGELDALTSRLSTVAGNSRAGADLTFRQLREALKAIIAAFPVYRTYITDDISEPAAADRAIIQKAVVEAKSVNAHLDPFVCDFIERVLTLQLLPELEDHPATLAREFVARFQQLTGPVMAKGLEDTAFYRYNRLISLNEVGGDPGEFGIGPEEFHNHAATITDRWPHTLLATATHDTKRGEDARARINILSEIPLEWEQALQRWTSFNTGQKIFVHGAPAPAANDEYLLYQSFVGSCPAGADQPEIMKSFCDRVVAFMIKALRESKSHTSWLQPDTVYEEAVEQFIRRILNPDAAHPFLDDFQKFQRRVSSFAKFNSLSQTLLKLTAPGVPDIYQGTELWDFSFVDPDNRRPVDYDLRQQLLIGLKERFAEGQPESHENVFELWRQDELGISKLYVIWRALELRQRLRNLFEIGSYDPLPAFGPCANHVCAFSRTHRQKHVIVVIPRLVCGLTCGKEIAPLGEEVWQDTILPLPNGRAQDGFRNVFTQETVKVEERDGNCVLRIAGLLNKFPVTLLESVTEP